MTSPFPGGGEPFFLFSDEVYRESIRVGPARTADVDTDFAQRVDNAASDARG